MPPTNSLLSAIVDSSDDAIVSKDLNGIITSWNGGAQRIFGYSSDEIVGQPVTTLIPADRQDEEPRILARLRRGERVDHFETVRRRKNGELFPVSLTISPIKDDAGIIVGASKIARDITEVRRVSDELRRIAVEREQLLESERAARASAERANRMKDEFIATVSHELRTPLNAIVGWTEVLAHGGSHDDVVEGIAVIKRNALVQAQLIEDLLDLSRITSGKLALNVEPVDLATVVRDAISTLQHAAEAKALSVKTVMTEGVCRLLGDPKRLQQVVWNLLTNAIKFTPKGGRILVSVMCSGSMLRLTVADNGSGIAPDFLPHLFERFTQADSSLTRRHGGLGIGLAIAKQLVELHAGTIVAASAGTGQGATFTVTLPVASAHSHREPPHAAPEPDAAALADLSGVRVLAIDDDRDSLEIIRRILTARNAEVRTAGSVAAALGEFGQARPDVLISDIGMPDRDGYELIKQLRALPGGARVPAAALTAMARPEDRMRALHAGFQTHVAKPVSAAELVAVVSALARMR